MPLLRSCSASCGCGGSALSSPSYSATARNQIIASGGRQTGEGLAIAGIVLGWIGVATFVWLALILGSLSAIIP